MRTLRYILLVIALLLGAVGSGPAQQQRQEGETWSECNGSSPARVCAVLIFDNGEERIVAFTTF